MEEAVRYGGILTLKALQQQPNEWPTILLILGAVLLAYFVFTRSQEHQKRETYHRNWRFDEVRTALRGAKRHLEAAEWMLMQIAKADASEDTVRAGIAGLAQGIFDLQGIAATLRRLVETDPVVWEALIGSWETQLGRAILRVRESMGEGSNKLSMARDWHASYQDTHAVLKAIIDEIGLDPVSLPTALPNFPRAS